MNFSQDTAFGTRRLSSKSKMGQIQVIVHFTTVQLLDNRLGQL